MHCLLQLHPCRPQIAMWDLPAKYFFNNNSVIDHAIFELAQERIYDPPLRLHIDGLNLIRAKTP
eukprot:1536814-Prorocentrum_lima.AAC.1